MLLRISETFDRAVRWLQNKPQPTRIRMMAAAIAAVVAVNFALYATCGLRGCPDPNALRAYQPDGATVLLDRNGTEFTDLAPVDRRIVQLSSLPEYVPAAFIAVEDKRFYQHHGVDWRRVAGAFLRNLKSDGLEGSSTITMQLSRNIFSDRLRANDRSLRRKLFETRVAKKIERQFSKQEILELYLNHIYFGNGAYGVENAAQQYFGKSARNLAIHEAALLAALPKAPTRYDPREHAARARKRRDLVLQRMFEQQKITGKEARRARNHALGITRDPPSVYADRRTGAYFAQVVRKQLEHKFGEDLYRKKFRVFTTLDVNAQRAAEAALAAALSRAGRHGEPEGAAVVMETLTGDVLAMVGGRDYRTSTYNRALLARRQAGSAFKPFVYAAAVAEGYPPSQPILDAPFTFQSNGRDWQPQNFDGRFAGMVTMRDALVESRNVPSVRLAKAVGTEKVAEFAHDAGIEANIDDTPMIALGITEVTPMELVNGYAAFAGMGTRAEPRYIQRVEDEKGRIVWKTKVERENVIDPAVAFVMTNMLADVVDRGTGRAVRAAGLEGPAAGKTGTTSDAADVWFVGYTPDVVAGLWIGYDERRPLRSDATGGSLAAPAWGSMMRQVYRRRPQPGGWIVPGEIETRLVDPASGAVLAAGCRPLAGAPREEVFVAGEEVEQVCPAGARKRGLFGSIGAFFASLFKTGDRPVRPPELERPDENLGSVRLVRHDDDDGRRKHGKGGFKGKKRHGREGRHGSDDGDSD